MLNSSIRKIIGLVILLIVILILMLLSSQIGGLTIRHDFSGRTLLELTVSDPIVRGVPVAVHWTLPPAEPDSELNVIWRDGTTQHTLASTRLHAQEARIIIPCATDDPAGTLILVDPATQQVLAQQAVTLLPATADCAFNQSGT